LDANEYTIYLNYAVVLLNNGQKDAAKDKFLAGEALFVNLHEDDKEPEIMDLRASLA